MRNAISTSYLRVHLGQFLWLDIASKAFHFSRALSVPFGSCSKRWYSTDTLSALDVFTLQYYYFQAGNRVYICNRNTFIELIIKNFFEVADFINLSISKKNKYPCLIHNFCILVWSTMNETFVPKYVDYIFMQKINFSVLVNDS